MKSKQKIIIAVIDIVFVLLTSLIIIISMRVSDNMRLSMYFGESHAGKNNISQLFYASDSKQFSNNAVLTEVFDDNVVSFYISEIDFNKDIIRFDPFNQKCDFSINKMELVYEDHIIFSVKGKEIKAYVDKTKGMKSKWTEDGLVCQSKKDNPRIIFKQSFSKKIYRYFFLLNRVVYVIAGVVALLFGLAQIRIMTYTNKISDGNSKADGEIHETGNADNSLPKKKSRIVFFVVTELLMALGMTLIYTLRYFEGHFGQVPFGQLIYHLHTPLDGTDVSSYKSVIILGVLIVLGVLVINLVVYSILRNRNIHYGYVSWIGMLAVIMLVCSVYRGIVHFEVVDYYRYTHEKTMLYEDNYVDGQELTLDFPEEKRNLVYIYLESMEMSFADEKSGGGMGNDNLIPGLTRLALENECFSDGSVLNGAHHVMGATYTMGALAAQTSGAPINENIVSNETLNGDWVSENNYLPGVWAIGDVLKEQGYNQEFLIGSKGEFAGRSSYFRGHGDYTIEDYNAAIDEGRIPSDYKVWWGYEDEKLFEFAKEDILKLSREAEPFNFTMLTVDTHFTDGYKCRLCDDKYDSQYSNVIACSDGQVTEFIEWLEGQEFYDNTTIVICGDHLTPDSLYVNSQGLNAFDRRTYTVVINPADGKKYSGAGRIYTTLDMYPTTLSAMGVEIEGDKLGLGVDLYSDTPTLAEKYGLDELNYELMKNSDYYKEKLLYK